MLLSTRLSWQILAVVYNWLLFAFFCVQIGRDAIFFKLVQANSTSALWDPLSLPPALWIQTPPPSPPLCDLQGTSGSGLKKLWTTSKSPLFTCFREVSQKSHVLFVNASSRGFLRRLLLKLLKDYGRSSLPSMNIAYASCEAYNSLVDDDDDWDVWLGISWELLERESRRFNG